MLTPMQSVETILNKVYGGKAGAHAALGGAKSSAWNWSKAGYFPASVAIKIAIDAKERGIELPLDEIPTLEKSANAA